MMRSLAQLSDLSGRFALISGGAGHMGRAMAAALAELGCTICLLDKDAKALDAAATEITRQWPVKVLGINMDLENEAARSSLMAHIGEEFGRLDILINNAGFVGDSQLQGWAVPFEMQRIDTWRRALEVNLTAAFHLSQSLLPLLRQSGHGSVINVGSIYGVLGPDLSLYDGTSMGNPAAYAASKGGLLQLTRWLATSIAPQVRVNCVSPGGIARGQAQEFISKYVEKTPLKRMGSEEDFKGIIAYLASDLSAWVTGQNIMVDGGWTAW